MTVDQLRGTCKEASEQLVKDDPSLRLVRGYYYCIAWGQQQHWWCEKEDGTVIDVTKDQFPSKGSGVYEEFDGIVVCETCGKSMPEDDALFMGRYPVCPNGNCARILVGV